MESKPELKPESKPELKPESMFKVVYRQYKTFECEKDKEKEFIFSDKYIITPTGDICHKIGIVEKPKLNK